MIPPLDPDTGNLPPGVHEATWGELVARYGYSAHRRDLLTGLRAALESLRVAGCRRVYVDGSFVTNKADPADFDACWEVSGVKPGLLDPSQLRASARRSEVEIPRRCASGRDHPGSIRRPDHRVVPAGPAHRPGERDRRHRSCGAVMIANEREYQITKEEIERFEHALDAPEPTTDDPDTAILRRATREGMESILQDLRDEAADYELLRSGATVLELHALPAVASALPHARARIGLTEADLAAHLGLPEEQIRRFEATAYAGATLEQVQAVLDALGIRISERLIVPWGPTADPADQPNHAQDTHDGQDPSVAGNQAVPRGHAGTLP